jgi:hypothetical protein
MVGRNDQRSQQCFLSMNLETHQSEWRRARSNEEEVFEMLVSQV